MGQVTRATVVFSAVLATLPDEPLERLGEIGIAWAHG